MKSLHPLTVFNLSNLEFGQHLKTIRNNLVNLSKTPITDTVLLGYLNNLDASGIIYDRAMVNIAKSDETAKIVAADSRRDKALSSLFRVADVFEFTEDENEQLAFASLKTLFDNYNGLQWWNFEEETNGIDNLIADLRNDKYSPSAQLLVMAAYIDRLSAANQSFKALFDGRTSEVALKENFDVKQLRSEMKQQYNDMVNYILTMAKALNTDQYNQALDMINTVRKYYADLLARREPGKENT